MSFIIIAIISITIRDPLGHSANHHRQTNNDGGAEDDDEIKDHDDDIDDDDNHDDDQLQGFPSQRAAVGLGPARAQPRIGR